MERGEGRSADERAAAREERQRARAGHDQGPEEGYEGDEGPRESGGWQRPDIGSINRYGGGMDVYARRRLIAGGAAVVVLLLLFVVFIGC